MRDLERKRIAEILKRAKAGEDDVNLKSAESLMDDAVVGVPENAPADYGDAGAAPVLGNPNDDRLVQAQGSMASPYFTDKATSESIAAGETPVQFSGRYGERVRNAGPDDLTLASPIHKVDRSDPRYRTGEPAPAETSETTDSAVAEGAFDYSKQQSWGDKYGGYNYTYIPLEDSKAGIIKVEWTDDSGAIKTATLDPTKPMSPKNERAYISIMDQRMSMDKPPSVHDLRPKPKAVEGISAEERQENLDAIAASDAQALDLGETGAGNEAATKTISERSDEQLRTKLSEVFSDDPAALEAIASADRDTLLGVLDDLRFGRTPAFESPIDLPPLSELPYSERIPEASRRAMKAEEAKAKAPAPKAPAPKTSPITGEARPKGDVGGRFADALISVPAAAKQRWDDPSDDVPGDPTSGTDTLVKALRERAEPDPRRAEGDVGGRISDFILGKRPGPGTADVEESEDPEIAAFRQELLGPSFAP